MTHIPGPIPLHLAARSSLTGVVSVLEMEEVKVVVKASIVREREDCSLVVGCVKLRMKIVR